MKALLDLPMVADTGTVARYCSGGVMVAGRMVERAGGQPLLVFAQRHLFDPLGIRASDVRWPFVLDSSNANTYAQLSMRPRDMLKLGVLFLDGGQWHGQEILSRAWVTRSTAPVTQMGSRAYGYFWWHQAFDVTIPAGTRRIDALNASGNGGQKIYIVPALELVAVFTGSNYNSDRDTPPNAIMRDVVLPALLTTPARTGRR